MVVNLQYGLDGNTSTCYTKLSYIWSHLEYCTQSSLAKDDALEHV